MGLTDHLDCLSLLCESVVATRDQAIDAMLERLAALRLIPGAIVPEIRASVLRREELGPTGIGEGVAIPHAWHPSLRRTVGALAVSRHGLDFESLDRLPVYIVVLLLTPPDQAGERAKSAMLDEVLRALRDASFRRSLRQAATEDELSAIVRAASPPEA